MPARRFPAMLAVLLLVLVLPATAFSQEGTTEGTACCWYRTDGTVFADLNADGIMNGSDYGLVGWTVTATDSNNVGVTSAVTGAGGYYIFPNGPTFCAVTFRLRVTNQSGWNQTFPVSPNYHQNVHGACDGTIFGPYDFGLFNCGNVQKIYTVDSEFNEGTLNGVITNSDQLELAPTPTTFGFGWIANADDGTVSKIDLATGNELAAYYTGPPDINGNYPYLNPSRTAVDEDGNCWVANRTEIGHPPSVTQILADSGVDFNNNTVIETSGDCCPADGQIGGIEILPWGQDERVVRHYQVGAINNNWARGMAIDKGGFLWVGLSSQLRVVKLRTDHPISVFGSNQPQTQVPEEASLPLCVGNSCYTPYGLALSPNGFLYASTLNQIAFEIDPGLNSGGTANGPVVTQNYIDHGPDGNYGIAVDQDCVVWLAKFFGSPAGCIRWDPAVGVNNPAAGWVSSNAGAQGNGRGITVDFNGDVWMATNGVDGVTKFDNANPPNVLGNFPTVTSNMPTGIGTASDGNMIMVGQLASDWEKRNVLTGAYMPLPGPQLAGYHPYTYSDFTGSLQSIVNKQQGLWTVTTDGGFPGLLWNYIDWHDLVPPQTSVTVEARSAYTLPSLASKPWTLVTTPGFQTPPYPGRYIETRVRLKREISCGQPFITPVLYDLTVAAVCDTCYIACPPDTVVECEGFNGANVAYSTSVIGASCDTTFTLISCDPPSGSLFPLGINVVTCTAVNASQDTITCAFTVTVTGDCIPTPTGACCKDQGCTTTTEALCEQQGGIYYGDGSDCTQGCTFSCLRPPAGLTAWWPMNGPPTGTTENLADPNADGALQGPPALQIGAYVNDSYDFPGNALTYINVPHSTGLNLGTGDFSIDVWVKNDSPGRQPIVDKRQGSGQPVQGYYFYLQDGYPGLQMSFFGTTADFVLDANNSGASGWVGDGQWHLIAVTVDRNAASGVQFYIDGVPVGPTFNPTSVSGTLNTPVDLFIAQSYPHFQSAAFYDGSLDELEIFKRELTPAEVDNLYAAGASGKCLEACYASELTNCCDGQAATAWFTICNYDVVAHTYSWGATPQPAGAGCTGPGASSFTPPSGTVSVPAGDCVTVPVEIACPTGIAVGDLACYQISVFNHDTGNLFGCRGSVKRPGWWCPKVTWPSGTGGVGTINVTPGLTVGRTVVVKINHIGVSPVPIISDVEVHPLDPGTGLPSPSLSLDGLPPGEPVVRQIDIPPGETSAEFELILSYPENREIGLDVIQIRMDDDMDGVVEPVAEAATRGSAVVALSVPPERDVPTGETSRPFLSLPNPFNRSGTIVFRIQGDGQQKTTLGLYDVSGRRVAIFLKKAMLEPGEHTVQWDGTDMRHQPLPSGVYFLRLQAPGIDETVKVVLVR